jgi:hypothetical protein
MKLMMLAELGSTGAAEMSVFHILLGRKRNEPVEIGALAQAHAAATGAALAKAAPE